MSASFKGPSPSLEGAPNIASHDIKYQQGFGGELSSEAMVAFGFRISLLTLNDEPRSHYAAMEARHYGEREN